MKLLILPISFLFIFNILNAQVDSLSHYSLEQLDSILKTKKKPQERLPYALAQLQKGEKELDIKDTTYAKLLFKTGIIYEKLQDFLNATTYLQQAIELQKAKIPKHVDYANSIYRLGLIYAYQGQYEKTKQLWGDAIEIRKEVLGNKHPDYIANLSNLAILYEKMGETALAELLFIEGMNIRKEVLGDKHPEYAKSLMSLVALYHSIGSYVLAEPLCKQAIEIRKEVLGDKHPEYAESLSTLAALYFAMGNYTLAEPLNKQALNIRKEVLGDKHLKYAESLNNLAILYIEMGNYSLAEPLHKEALDIRKEVLGEKHPEYASSLINLAILYRNMGRYTLAEPLYIEALKIQKEVLGDKHPAYAGGLINFAILYYSIGNYTLAESLFKEAINILKEVLGDKHPNVAGVLMNLANLYSTIENYTESEPLLIETISIRKEVLGEKHPEYAKSLMSLSILYTSMHNYTLAESLSKEALNIMKEVLGDKHPDYADGLTNLAILYKKIGNYSLVKPLYIQAMNIRKEVLGDKHPEYASSLNNLGLLYTTIGAYDTAHVYYTQLLPLCLDYLALQSIALGEKAKQDLFKTIAPNINIINSFAAFHCQHDSLFAWLQNSLLFTKGFALAGVSELLPLIKSLNDSTLNVTYATWTYTKNQLGKAYEMGIAERAKKGINIDSLQRLAGEQESAIMRGSAALKQRLGYDKQRFYYKDMVANIRKDEVVIDFVRFENEKKDTAWYYALVTQAGWEFPKYIPLCMEKELEPYASAEINPFKESYITKPSDNKALYDLIIRPLEPYLKKKKRVHWAPVGLMNQVAMGTLKNEKGKMLGELLEIHQYGSLKDFIIKKQGIGSTGSVDKKVLLVGDIAFDLDEKEHLNLVENTKEENLYTSRSIPTDSTHGSNRFVPLKGTKVELENLNKAFTSQKWTIEQLQQKEALEEKVREYSGDKTPSVLHFATHGFFIPAKKQGADNPLLRSGIALAGANRVWMGKPQLEGVEDGLWTAYEIANSNLMQADLVVLSACETAKGQIDPHEGVVGLQRSFKIAGVENMLLSLWQVPDKETVELMEEFYKYYLKGETPSVSLRKAQMVMRKKYPEPYYWAAFVLIE